MTTARLSLAFLAVCAAVAVEAGQPSGIVHHPELILHHAKVVTADERFTIAQAVAIESGRIVAVGGDAAVLGLAGPSTRRIDVGGRTILPGLIDTHVHLHDYALYHWAPSIAPEVAEAQFIESSSVEGVLKDLAARIAGDVPRLAPEEWATYDIRGGPGDISVDFARRTTRRELDALLRDRPLFVQPENTDAILNSRALDLVLAKVPRAALTLELAADGEPTGRLGRAATALAQAAITRHRRPSLTHAQRLVALGRAFRRELEEWASYGFTTWVSKMDADSLDALARLEADGMLPIRTAYAMETFKDGTPDMARRVWNTTGYGSPLLWMVGISFSGDGSYPDACTTLPTARKHLEDCKIVPGNEQWDTAFEAIKRGFRIAGTHAAGDLAADYMLTLIEQASEAGGLSLEDVRRRRHVLDHCSQNPRPDQIERGKRLGVSWACGPKYIIRAPRVAQLYGRDVIDRLAVPARSLVDAGLRPAFHTDGHHGGPMAFQYLQALVTRKDLNGVVWGAHEAVDRRTALLMATRWGAEYALRERDLGSLEPGKWADLIVTDRDFLTAPVDDLAATRVLLTLVGGRTIFAAAPFESMSPSAGLDRGPDAPVEAQLR